MSNRRIRRRGGSAFQVDIETFIEQLRKNTELMKKTLMIVTERVSAKMAEWAKENARWTDRTGNARRGLYGEAKWIDNEKLSCVVKHTVEYGKWLEFAHERRFAILDEAIQSQKDFLISEYKRIAGFDFSSGGGL